MSLHNWLKRRKRDGDYYISAGNIRFDYVFCWCLILLLIPVYANALDRCATLVQTVRVEHIKYFGLHYPYWYGVGQLKQESACRETVTAFDAGQGVAQFMPKTAQYIQSLMGEKLNPYNAKQAIRMQAFYIHRIQRYENWTARPVSDGVSNGDHLWIAYQIYNGGKSLLYKEYQRAKKVNWAAMKAQCKRNKIQMKWGILDLCEVNYDYSKKIEKYGNQYRRGVDGMRYW